MTTRRGRVVVVALAAAAVVLVVVELALGGIGFGRTHLADPCTAKPVVRVGGIDGAVQRFALAALNGAACELHTSREELVLSFTRSGKRSGTLSPARVNRALRHAVERAASDLPGGGLAHAVVALFLRQIVANPLRWLLEHAR